MFSSTDSVLAADGVFIQPSLAVAMLRGCISQEPVWSRRSPAMGHDDVRESIADRSLSGVWALRRGPISRPGIANHRSAR